MKVGVVAYACQPGVGSEPGVGWNTAYELARHHEVWLVTRRNNRNEIEESLARNPRPSLHVEYHDVDWALRFKRGNAAVYIYSYLWQATVHRVLRPIHERVGLDVAHQITFGSIRYPSSLGRLGIPYVLGPLGGGEEVPFGFWLTLGPVGAVLEALRWVSNRLAMADPLVRRGLASAARVLAATPSTQAFLNQHGFHNIDVVPSVAVDAIDPRQPLSMDPVRPSDRPSEFTSLYVGRLQGWKGVHLALMAVAKAVEAGVPIRFRILGRGPADRRLRRLIEALDLGGGVEWLPAQPTLDHVRELYRQADVFLFPSLHDSGGMVVIEAMAVGCPVICLELGGPALSVTPATGIRVRATTPMGAIDEMARALAVLASDPDRRAGMGRAARQRVLDSYTWEGRAETIGEIYAAIVPPAPGG